MLETHRLGIPIRQGIPIPHSQLATMSARPTSIGPKSPSEALYGVEMIRTSAISAIEGTLKNIHKHISQIH